MTEESWISRMADASTMFLTMKRLMALSLATSTPDASQRTLFTCRSMCTDIKKKSYEVSQHHVISEIHCLRLSLPFFKLR